MAECTSDCASCGESCSSRQSIQDMREPCNPMASVHRVVGVVSGKGGVGKSMVTACLAVAMAKKGFRVGILDADITGPSIPKSFGIHERAVGSEVGILPAVTPGHIAVMSLNLLTQEETDPVIWRGPVIAGVVKQFWTDVLWGDLDYLFVDLPPGTGDVPLTVFQTLPVDGIVVVTSPQELVSLIVTKAVKMAQMMEIPVLGLVENFSSYKCPGCGEIHPLFGPSHLEETARANNVAVLAKLPLDPTLAAACDAGEIESIAENPLRKTAQTIHATLDAMERLKKK